MVRLRFESYASPGQLRGPGPDSLTSFHCSPFHSQVSPRAARGRNPPYKTVTPRAESYTTTPAERRDGPAMNVGFHSLPSNSHVSEKRTSSFRPPKRTRRSRLESYTRLASARARKGVSFRSCHVPPSNLLNLPPSPESPLPPNIKIVAPLAFDSKHQRTVYGRLCRQPTATRCHSIPKHHPVLFPLDPICSRRISVILSVPRRKHPNGETVQRGPLVLGLLRLKLRSTTVQRAIRFSLEHSKPCCSSQCEMVRATWYLIGHAQKEGTQSVPATARAFLSSKYRRRHSTNCFVVREKNSVSCRIHDFGG